MTPRQLQYWHKGNNPPHERWIGKGRSVHVSRINLKKNGDLYVDVVERRILIRSSVKCRVRVDVGCSLFAQKDVEDSYFFIRPSMELVSGGGVLTSGMDCASFERIMMIMLEECIGRIIGRGFCAECILKCHVTINVSHHTSFIHDFE